MKLPRSRMPLFATFATSGIRAGERPIVEDGQIPAAQLRELQQCGYCLGDQK
jgi:hypothetical protein